MLYRIQRSALGLSGVQVVVRGNMAHLAGTRIQLTTGTATGPTGPDGPPGPGASQYLHEELIAITEWGPIEHNLGTMFPEVRVFQTDDSEVEGEVTLIDSNTLTISFPIPIAGTAVITL